ncbi:hypothetical protein [Sphingobium ummariense]|nr:hypothetical protein [Sphingobium ummariense]
MANQQDGRHDRLSSIFNIDARQQQASTACSEAQGFNRCHGYMYQDTITWIIYYLLLPEHEEDAFGSTALLLIGGSRIAWNMSW